MSVLFLDFTLTNAIFSPVIPVSQYTFCSFSDPMPFSLLVPMLMKANSENLGMEVLSEFEDVYLLVVSLNEVSFH